MFLKNVTLKTDVALVIDWQFHKKRKWVSIFTPYLVDAFIDVFEPLIISSQLEYEVFKKKIKFVLSMEPGWAAPKLSYDVSLKQTICVMASDPHNKTHWFQDYVIKNDISYVLSQYYSPFFYHFPYFPVERFVHFPWAVPDQFISNREVAARDDRVVVFGAQHGKAYDVRNWCREQEGVASYENSGVENRMFSDQEYFSWLEGFDALVAAGSSDPRFNLVTPKYFEIPASGALLVGQQCSDLERLGFNDNNALLFMPEDFIDKHDLYRNSNEKFLQVRRNGLDLIKQRHLLSNRLKHIENLFWPSRTSGE